MTHMTRMTKMKSRLLLSSAASLAVLAFTTASAQPPQGGPGGQRHGPPSPERMVEHAMTFDADGDGKLDRAELTKFAEELHSMRGRGGPGGPGGRPDGQGGRSDGPGGRRTGRGPGQGVPGGGGNGPERPRLPE